MCQRIIKAAAIIYLLGTLSATSSNAAPGQRHSVQEENTSVFEIPNATSPVVMRLSKGDRVIEWRRRGSWIKITRLGVVGSDGWVKLSSISPEITVRQIEIKLNSDNEFIIEAKVNGKNVLFLIDTGATHTMLSPNDAKSIGFNVNLLNYSGRARVVGGTVSIAAVKLREIEIGSFKARNVDAGIPKKHSGKSLLGIDFLKKLESYEVRDEKLVLRW